MLNSRFSCLLGHVLLCCATQHCQDKVKYMFQVEELEKLDLEEVVSLFHSTLGTAEANLRKKLSVQVTYSLPTSEGKLFPPH